jgi:microcystin synthetase protein McyG
LNANQLQQLEEWFASNPSPDRIIYLLNSDAKDQPESILLNRCNYLLNLLKAIQTIPNPPQLFLVTQGAQPFELEQPSLGFQSPLWAMGRVIALENPQLWGGMLDLDPDLDINQNITALLLGLTHAHDEDHLVFRKGQGYVARLLPLKSLETKTVKIQPEATYLITGGIGHLGLELAEHLVNLGAKHLILTTRRSLPARFLWDSAAELAQISEKIRKLEEKGASIEVISADVGNFEAMQAIFTQIEKTAYPLRGIFHLAGISGRQAQLKDCTLQDIEAVFQAKVKGSWNLHQLSLGTQLDYFVLFSSAGAIWGAKEQGLYDTVSHWLDALAHFRHLQGLPATALNWALLAGNGIVSQDYEDWLKQIGIREIAPDMALRVMDAIMASNQTQVLIADVDWVRFKNIYQFKGEKPLLKNLGLSEIPIKSVQESDSVLDLLEDIPLGERREYLLEYVSKQVRIILGIKSMPDSEQGLIEMGIDSLSSIELKNRLEKGLEVLLPTSLVFDFPNIRRLVDYLFDRIFGEKVQKTAQKMINFTEVQQEISEDLILQELTDLEAFLGD